MFKEFFKKNLGYYISRNEYYESVAAENGFLKRISSIPSVANSNTIATDHRILFNNRLETDCERSEILKVLGRPNYSLEKRRSEQHQILFYKKLISSFRTKLELHLLSGRFLLGFITFDVVSTSDKLKILQAISEKYGLSMDQIDLEDLRIEDKFGNFIQLIDSVHLTLAYGRADKATKQTVFDLANQNEALERSIQHRKESQLLNNI